MSSMCCLWLGNFFIVLISFYCASDTWNVETDVSIVDWFEVLNVDFYFDFV